MTTPVAVVIAAVIIAGTVAFIFRYAVATSNTENESRFAAALGGEMMMADDGTPEELWQRLAEESPHTSDDEIERLFIAASRVRLACGHKSMTTSLSG